MSSSFTGLAHAVGVAVGDYDARVVEQPVQEADGGGVLGQEPAPLVKWPVAGHAECPAFVGGGDEPEQELGSGVVERGEPDFVDEDEVAAEQVLDDAADGVAGHAAVERLSQVGGGEVPDFVPGVDGGGAEGDQDVAFPGAGRPGQAQVLPGPDPFQGREVVQGRAGNGACFPVELAECLDHGERRCFHPGPGVGRVAGGDLGAGQGPQELLRRPPLGLRRDTAARGRAAASRRA